MTPEDDEPQRPKGIILGEDLYELSVGELEERILALQEEIERTKAAKQQKAGGLAAAEALFGKS